jgi:hypothetical protein
MCAFSSFLRDLKKKTNRMEDGLVCLKIDKNEFTQRKYNTVQYDNPKDRERGCRAGKEDPSWAKKRKEIGYFSLEHINFFTVSRNWTVLLKGFSQGKV